MKAVLERLQIKEINAGACTGPDGWITDPIGEELISYSPATGQPIARVVQTGENAYNRVVEKAAQAFQSWRTVPAPKRGLVIRDFADALRLSTFRWPSGRGTPPWPRYVATRWYGNLRP